MCKNVLLVLAILALLLISQGCQKKSSDVLKAYRAQVEKDENNNERLKLDNKTLFTDQDIKSYNWETHEIQFKDDFLEALEKGKNKEEESTDFFMGGSKLLGTTFLERFVLMINEDEIYHCHFEPSFLSSYLPNIYVSDYNNGIKINFIGVGDDVRNDDRIYNLLKSKDLLDY